MKFKKLQLSLAAFFTAAFTVIASSTASASTLDYGTSLKRMQDLGIMEGTITDTSSYITRGQLVKSIVISEGKASSAAALNGSTIYPDIDPSSSLSGFINQGVNLGTEQGIKQNVVTGRADGSFHPNDQVSYGELCTMMVRLLGYSDSDVTGAWPNNYIQKAADLDLTTDITLRRSDKVTVGIEALMFDRLFDSTMKNTGTTSKFFSDNYYNDTSVTGTLKEAVVLGNSKTNLSLAENQILTDKGTYSLNIGVSTPEVGGKYKMYIDGTSVTKVAPKMNSTEGYAVTSVSDSFITYTDDNKTSQTMVLPKASAYYHNGVSVSRDMAVKSMQPFSSVVVAKNSNGDNDYIVVADPAFSSPLVYDTDSKEVAELLCDTGIKYIYKDGEKYDADDTVDFDDQDVVYKISDLWGKNSCIYIYNHVVSGEITAINPNMFNPTSITMDVSKESTTSTETTSPIKDSNGNPTNSSITTTTKNTTTTHSSATYTFSEYFNRTNDAIEELYIGNEVNLVLGIDGKVLEVY